MTDRVTVSQSPSLRGSGRFCMRRMGQTPTPPQSQSPSLRGSGRFLTPDELAGGMERMSQSPSLRGSGRFKSVRMPKRW